MKSNSGNSNNHDDTSSSGGGCCYGKSKKHNKGGQMNLNKKGMPADQDIFGASGSQQKIIEAKVVLLGDSGVGKSSIAQRYCKNLFSESHDVTIGGAYLQQIVTLSDGTQVKLHIWDTGGSERFRSMVSLYYREASAAIICYDIADDKSFTSVHFWINEMINNNDKDEFVLALAGNKCDIDESQRKVTRTMSEQLSQKHNMVQSETSAKTGEGVQELFKQVAERIVKLRK